MIIHSVVYLLFLSIAGVTSAQESTGPSAEDAFNSFMSPRLKVRSGAKYNATAIAEGVKQGTELVSQMQDAFDKVQEIGKKIGEVGTELFKNDEAMLKAGKVMARALGSVAKFIGPALGGAGAAFALISMFLPEVKSGEMEAIESGFREMHQRFDQISTQIKDLDNKVDFYETIREYNKIGVIVRDLKPVFAGVLDEPKSNARREAFNVTCTDREADRALTLLHEMIAKPELHQGLKPLVNSVVRYYKLDYPVIMSWFERMTQYAYVLATIKSACYGARFGKDDPAYVKDLKLAEDQVKDIVATLAKFEEKFTNIEEEYVEFIKEDLEAAVKVETVSEADEAKINSLCDNFEEKLPGAAGGACRGHIEINVRRVSVNAKLRTKYFWMNWAVVVYEDNKNTDQCTERQPGQRFYHLKDSDAQGVVVSWDRKDAELSQVREQALTMLNEAINGVQISKGQSRAGAVKEKAQEWIKTGADGKAAYCTFGGYEGHYHRSIATSGVAAHRSDMESRMMRFKRAMIMQIPVQWRNDYVIMFT